LFWEWGGGGGGRWSGDRKRAARAYGGGRGSEVRIEDWREARAEVSWARRWRVWSRVLRSVGERVVIVMGKWKARGEFLIMEDCCFVCLLLVGLFQGGIGGGALKGGERIVFTALESKKPTRYDLSRTQVTN